jgi:ABC-type antimicrobial peptide transport system permease subunit
VTLQVRSTLAAGALAREITSIVRAGGGDIVPFNAQTFSDAIAEAPTGLLLPRLGSLLATAFGALGLLLSVVGVYGVVAYGASQRTRELALRMALGATPGEIRTTVLKSGTGVVLAGTTLGVALAIGGARLAAGISPGVRLSDPLIFLAAAAIVGTSAFAACYVPARRAMRVPAATVLRES